MSLFHWATLPVSFTHKYSKYRLLPSILNCSSLAVTGSEFELNYGAEGVHLKTVLTEQAFS